MIVLRRCGREVPSPTEDEAPTGRRSRSAQERRIRSFAKDADKWGDIHCGFDEDTISPQYELIASAVALQAALFFYMEWWSGFVVMCIIFLAVSARRLGLRLVKPWGWVLGLLESVAVTALAVILNGIFFSGWYALGTFLLALAVQFFLSRRHIKRWRYYLWTTGALQVALLLIVAVSILTVTQDEDDYTNFCNHTRHPHCRSFTGKDLPTHLTGDALAFCDLAFSLNRPDSRSVGPKLALTDFALLSALAYESNATLRKALTTWFPGWNIVYERRVGRLEPDATLALRSDWTTFFEFSDPANETTVFAVRGTQSPLDIMQDINIWSPIAITQLAGLIGPDINLVVARAVLLMSTAVYGGWMQKNYFAVLLAHVRDRVAADPNRRFYLTGHSLGGGLAKLVSADTGVSAVTFSSPGVKAIHTLLYDGEKVTRDEGENPVVRLHRRAYTVVPDNDFVPLIDGQLGTKIPIKCSGGPLSCHSMGNTLCELLTQCGRPNTSGPVLVACGLCPAYKSQIRACRHAPDDGPDTALRH